MFLKKFKKVQKSWKKLIYFFKTVGKKVGKSWKIWKTIEKVDNKFKKFFLEKSKNSIVYVSTFLLPALWHNLQ